MLGRHIKSTPKIKSTLLYKPKMLWSWHCCRRRWCTNGAPLISCMLYVLRDKMILKLVESRQGDHRILRALSVSVRQGSSWGLLSLTHPILRRNHRRRIAPSGKEYIYFPSVYHFFPTIGAFSLDPLSSFPHDNSKFRVSHETRFGVQGMPG